MGQYFLDTQNENQLHLYTTSAEHMNTIRKFFQELIFDLFPNPNKEWLLKSNKEHDRM